MICGASRCVAALHAKCVEDFFFCFFFVEVGCVRWRHGPRDELVHRGRGRPHRHARTATAATAGGARTDRRRGDSVSGVSRLRQTGTAGGSVDAAAARTHCPPRRREQPAGADGAARQNADGKQLGPVPFSKRSHRGPRPDRRDCRTGHPARGAGSSPHRASPRRHWSCWEVCPCTNAHRVVASSGSTAGLAPWLGARFVFAHVDAWRPAVS